MSIAVLRGGLQGFIRDTRAATEAVEKFSTDGLGNLPVTDGSSVVDGGTAGGKSPRINFGASSRVIATLNEDLDAVTRKIPHAERELEKIKKIMEEVAASRNGLFDGAFALDQLFAFMDAFEKASGAAPDVGAANFFNRLIDQLVLTIQQYGGRAGSNFNLARFRQYRNAQPAQTQNRGPGSSTGEWP